MKFSQVSAGQHFLFKQISYVKSSALIAEDSKTGKNRFFKLSETVTLIGDASTDKQKNQSSDTTHTKDEVLLAFDDALLTLKTSLADTDLDIKKIIDTCRLRFLKHLNQTG